MGIDVSAGRIVSHNPSHNFGVDTETTRPSYEVVAGVQVACLFRRIDRPRGNGDGNPLIYALKSLNGYTMDIRSQAAISARVLRLIPLSFPNQTFDFVAPVPSSSRVTQTISQAAIDLLKPQQGQISQLRKITVREAHIMLAGSRNLIQHRDMQDFSLLERRLGSAPQGGRFILKDVPTRLRRYFTPVVCNSTCVTLNGASVLVVDDLLSSGVSLASAFESLRNIGAGNLRGMVLLGSLRR